MAADLTNLTAAVATLTTDVAAVVAEVQTGKVSPEQAAAEQAAVDAVTAEVTTLSGQLTSVLPAQPAPVA